MTNSIDELEEISVALIIGSNTTEAHPVIAAHLKRAAMKGAQLVVADPRYTGIARFASLYLPLKVGTDVALLNGIMHVIIQEGLEDTRFIQDCTEDYENLKATVMNYQPSWVAQITGLPEQDIVKAARMLASARPASLIYTLGITEHACGVDNVLSCANLQMLLGNTGSMCGGVNPLRGQNNVQGACDMGALPNVFCGYQKVMDEAVRKKFEQFWDIEHLPERVGLTIPKMLDSLKDGSVKALYFIGENLLLSEPNMAHTKACLDNAEFLVTQDIFVTETARLCHVVFPAASWAEEDGTFTNSERRVNRVRKAIEPPGQAKPDWWIISALAEAMGSRWANRSAKEIWDNEISILSPQLKGIKYYRIEGDGLQWPVLNEEHMGTCYLHKGGCFTRGRGKFHGIQWLPPVEVPDSEYPFTLTTGRRLYHYHTRTQTGRSEGLEKILPEEFLEINPKDAEILEIRDSQKIKIASRRGELVVTARVTEKVQPGLVFMAFHFAEANANVLTNNVFDPVSDTAEYKACAVKIMPA